MKNNFHNKEIGKHGEDLACKYLEKIGHIILCRNFSTNNSEIDIITKDKNELVFVEVKTRTSKQYGAPVDSIDNLKKKHIISAGKYYIHINLLEKENIRFDIVEVYINEKGNLINHIKNVFF